jgi:hypothetical protein
MAMLIFHNVPVAIAIVSAVLAYIIFRRRKGRRLDPRSELAEARQALRVAVEALPAQLDAAKRSRTMAAEATGLLKSAAMQQWLSELDIDFQEVKLLEAELPIADTDYPALSDMESDIRLLEIFALSLRADILADKYPLALSERIALSERVALSEDDRDGETPIDQLDSLSEPPGVRHPPLSLSAPS